MKIAVISDIHGNCMALEAVLTDLEQHPADTLVCLGDAIQGGAQPAQTVAALRRLACPVVMGNADAWLLTGENTSPTEAITEQQLAVREWTLHQLSDADKQFIQSFRPTIEIELEGGRTLLCFHGSPHSFDDLIFPETPEDDFQRLLDGSDPSFLFTGGHTHLQQVRRLGDSFFFNPGSVGVAFNRHQPEENLRLDPWAEYAALISQGDRLALEFRRVPYDPAQLIRTTLSSGRPYADLSAAQYEPKT
ncbi:MAG: metallophosphoesterase family protein [Chloroflexia bacterium]